MAATSVIVVTPAVTSTHDLHARAVALTAGSSDVFDAALGMLTQYVGDLRSADSLDTASLPPVFDPYTELFTNTSANLQAIADEWLADPFPFLSQLLTNLESYAQTTITSLGNAADDFVAGLTALPASLQAAVQELLAGNFGAAVNEVVAGLVNLFVTGVNTSDLANITLEGAFGDLLPILTIPGDIAQNFTNIIDTITNTLISLALTSFNPVSLSATLNLFIGLPLALGLSALGSPVTTAAALGESTAAFVDALEAGNLVGALTALVDAPAVVVNGFLNGQAPLAIPLTVQLNSLGVGHGFLYIPFDGILVPLEPFTAELTVHTILKPVPIAVTITGTPAGGIIPALVNYLPQQLAKAIDGPLAVFAAEHAAPSAASVLDPSTVLNLADLPHLGSLGAVFDPAALTDVTSLAGSLIPDVSGLLLSLVP